MPASLSFLPVLIVPLIAFGIMFLVFRPVYLRYRNRRQLLSTGNLGVADVVSSSQTGVSINRQPEMRVVLDVENTGGTPRRVEVKQVFDLGSIPRAGDRVYVLSDPTNPANVVLAPAGTGEQLRTAMAAAPGASSLTNVQVQDMLALTPALQQANNMGVIKLVSVTPGPGSNTQFVGDIDAIGQPPRRVTFSQMVQGGQVPPAGTRTYVFIDPANPNTIALVPPSLLNGHTLPTGANRLDPLVLGPQILKDGAKATGLVNTSQEVPLGDASLAARGITKWALGMTVTPDNGQPAYPAQLTISLLNQERVARMTPVGTKLPLRYDPLDPQTFSIDGPAMGYPNPYDDLLKVLQGNMPSAGTVPQG